ncbi:MAG: D-amino acid dehydrogenase [Alphaproteobacteria bacterium]|nr:D-amino acid dehydrogenase [Alphaproteobacteria bacterium]
MKVLVLGSGVVGVTAAYFLARDGHEVTVIDRQPRAANETSFANAGLVAPGHAYAWASPKAPKILWKSLFSPDQALRLKLRADPRMWAWFLLFLRQCTAERARANTINKLRLCLYSRERLHDIVADTDVAFDGQGGGCIYVYRTPENFEAGVAHTGILRDNGMPLEVLDPDGAVEKEPALDPVKHKIAGAIFAPLDESGDAHIFSNGLADHCREKLGVTFAFETTIRAIDVEGDRVRRVVTDKGDHMADAYVLSLGCDSPFLARPIGIKLPIYPVKGYSVTLPVGQRNAAPVMGGVDEENLVAWARMGDRIRLTSTAEFSGYDRSHKPEDFRAMFAAARDLFPDAADYDQPSYWAGLRPMTPEGTPFLGKALYENLFLNTGQGHMGWTMAHGSGKITADLVAGRAPEIDLAGMTLADR